MNLGTSRPIVQAPTRCSPVDRGKEIGRAGEPRVDSRPDALLCVDGLRARNGAAEDRERAAGSCSEREVGERTHGRGRYGQRLIGRCTRRIRLGDRRSLAGAARDEAQGRRARLVTDEHLEELFSLRAGHDLELAERRVADARRERDALGAARDALKRAAYRAADTGRVARRGRASRDSLLRACCAMRTLSRSTPTMLW